MKVLLLIFLVLIQILNANSNEDIVSDYVKIVQQGDVESFKYMEAVSMLNGYLIGKTMIKQNKRDEIKELLETVKIFNISQHKKSNFKLFAISYEFNSDKSKLLLLEAFINKNGYVRFNQREIKIKQVVSLFPNEKPYDGLFRTIEDMQNDKALTTIITTVEEPIKKVNHIKMKQYAFDYISCTQTLDIKTKKIPEDKKHCGASSDYSKLYKLDGETYIYKGTKDIVYEKVLQKNDYETKEIYVIQSLLKSN